MTYWGYLWRVQRIFSLIKKDFTVDWRQQNPLTGTILYLISTILATYMAFEGFVSIEVWNALFWIILLFISISALSKSFIQEEKRSHYYFFLCDSSEIISAKLIYSFIYLLVLAFVSLVVYAILLGNPIVNYPLFLINLVLGCLGLSSVFTMVSAIAFRTTNKSIMMAVLGFPIILPVLVLAIKNSFNILDGYVFIQIQGNIFSLLSVDLIIIVSTYVLFPFIWKS